MEGFQTPLKETNAPRFNMGGFFPTRPAQPTSPPIIPRMDSGGGGGAVPGGAFSLPSTRTDSPPPGGGGFRFPVDGMDFSGLSPAVEGAGTNRPRPAKSSFIAPVAKPAASPVAPTNLESSEFSVYSPNDFERMTGGSPPATAAPVAGAPLGAPAGWTEFEDGGRARLSEDPNTPMQDMGKEVHDYFDVDLPSGGKVRIPQAQMAKMLGLVTTGKTQDERNHDQNGFIMPTATRKYDPNAKSKGDVIRGIKSPVARAEAFKNPEAFFAAEKKIAIGEGTLQDYRTVGVRKSSDGSDYGSVREEVGDNRMIRGRYGRSASETTTRQRTRKKTEAEWLAEKNAPGLNRVADQRAAQDKRSVQDREDAVAADKHQNALELKQAGNETGKMTKRGSREFDIDGKPMKTDMMYDEDNNLVVTNVQRTWVESWLNEYNGYLKDNGKVKLGKGAEAEKVLGNLKAFGITDPSKGLAQIDGSKKTLKTPVAASPSVGAVVDGYKFTGGDPADSKNWKEI